MSPEPPPPATPISPAKYLSTCTVQYSTVQHSTVLVHLAVVVHGDLGVVGEAGPLGGASARPCPLLVCRVQHTLVILNTIYLVRYLVRYLAIYMFIYLDVRFLDI